MFILQDLTLSWQLNALCFSQYIRYRFQTNFFVLLASSYKQVIAWLFKKHPTHSLPASCFFTGEAGAPPTIPGNAGLVFETELMRIA
jgi:hypothetical protein